MTRTTSGPARTRWQPALSTLVELSRPPLAKPSPDEHRKPWRHAVLIRRLAAFTAVGLTVFLGGALLQWTVVPQLGIDRSYAIQAAAGVEVSWALNWWLTWRGRQSATASLWKWNTQLGIGTILGFSLYLSLMHGIGMNWLAASAASTALFAPVNYVVADKWSFAPATEAVEQDSGRQRRRLPLTRRHWVLVGILALQAGLSLRLIWSNTAFQDEALYLWVGHLEWVHWLRGVPIPAFQKYLSGAPVIYPPLGALADAYGGLAAARGLSLCFMLGATLLLYDTTRRITNRNAALFAAGLFAGVGATGYLGAFATYDAMSLFLLALGTWLGVLACSRRSLLRAALLITASLVLVLANATKYASALFDPVAILTAVFMGWRRSRRAGIVTGVLLVLGVSCLTLAGLRMGGHSYWQGITFTTLTRKTSTSPPFAIWFVSLGWAGFVGGLALIGALVMVGTARNWPLRLLGVCLAGAVWLAPAEQARIHTFASLFKHVGFGEWFGAIMAGFALSSLLTAVPRVKVAAAVRVALATVAASTVIGALLAGNQFNTWPNVSKVLQVLRPLVTQKGSVLAGDNGPVLEYYFPATSAFIIDYQAQFQSAQAAAAQFRTASFQTQLRRRTFTVIALSNYRAWIGADRVVSHEIAADGGYRLAAAIPYSTAGWRGTYQIWVRSG